MSKMPRKVRERRHKIVGDHQQFLSRITKTLYYGKTPPTDRLSLPVTELAAEIFSESQRGRSLDRLHCDAAADISTNACVSPCSLMLAVLYVERLKQLSPEYLERTAPSDLFLVSLMVSCKFLFDDGEPDEVYMDEWAASGRVPVKHLVQLERDFLDAINWEVYVNEPTFWKKLTQIETTLAARQGLSRGYFTYTELFNLFSTLEVQIVQFVATISLILMASYIAALLSLAGSVVIVAHVPGTSIQLKSTKIQDDKMLVPAQSLYPAPVEDPISDTILPEIPNISKTERIAKNEFKAANVLKTSLFLASIEGLLKPYCNHTNKNGSAVDDAESTTWDWWNLPSMQWLTEISKLGDIVMAQLDSGYFRYYLETYMTSRIPLELEDHIRKATKTRIQDQLENSWHKEWIDTIRFQKFPYYVEDVKA